MRSGHRYAMPPHKLTVIHVRVDKAATLAEIKAADNLVETRAAATKVALVEDSVEINLPVRSHSQLMTLGTPLHQLVDSAEMTKDRKSTRLNSSHVAISY